MPALPARPNLSARHEDEPALSRVRLAPRTRTGLFHGGLYISYTLASIILGFLFLVIYLLEPSWDLGLSLLLAVALFIPFVPAVTRYARIIWIHFDRWAWPESRG